MLRDLTCLRTLKNFLRLSAFVLCAFVGTTFADNFKSLTFDASSPQTIRVHDDQFMLIRNFTQETGSDHGVVTVAKPNAATATSTPAVLAAAILDQTPVEVINSVVIAGPADVTFTCGTSGGNCFISYKKDDN